LICIFPSIIILELIRNPIFIAVLVLELFWLISIARKYIQPLNILHKNLETPSNLSTAFFKTRNIPIEIRKIFSSLIDLLASNQEDINTFLSDKKMFTSVLRNMNDGTLIANEEGIITLINQSARLIFNIPGEHAVGSTLVEVLRVHQMNELFEKCTTTKQQQMASFETHADRKYIQCIATPLDPELPSNILFLFQDLTRMRQLEIIRQDFVSNVSHELRTPLASVKLIAETLQESALDDPPAARKFLKSMDSEVDNLIQLVEELLELSKIESGRVPLEKQWTHPIDIIKTAGDRMVLQANRAGLQFSYFADGNLPRIFIDGARLEQVLVNLMHNAIKFTKPGGSIEASAYRDKENIVFYVRDSGIGIPQKDLERIFERFYKTDRSRSERGTGLGLSISRHLVESHSGKIWAESKPGTSSTFYFSIPIS
jgi:two-component system phosphate regulon sensor histidine kinase PhoR